MSIKVSATSPPDWAMIFFVKFGDFFDKLVDEGRNDFQEAYIEHIGVWYETKFTPDAKGNRKWVTFIWKSEEDRIFFLLKH